MLDRDRTPGLMELGNQKANAKNGERPHRVPLVLFATMTTCFQIMIAITARIWSHGRRARALPLRDLSLCDEGENPSYFRRPLVWGELLLPICLLLTMLGWPFFSETQHTEQIFEGVFLLLIVVAAAAASTRRVTFMAVVAFGLLSFIMDTVSSDTLLALERLATVFDLLFSLTLALVLIERIFGTTGRRGLESGFECPQRLSAHRVRLCRDL